MERLNNINIDDVMERLSKERPIFHSEADFQHSLAWKIHEIYPELNIRLEKGFSLNNKKIHIDIFITYEENIWLFELKYKTAKLEIKLNNEEFILAKQSAYNLCRYDFLNDVSRLEQIKEQIKKNSDIKDKNIFGFAIFLTNDKNYWNNSNRNTKDKEFRIHNNRIIKGELKWNGIISEKIEKERGSTIDIKGNYLLTWKNYSNLNIEIQKNKKIPDKFRYLIV
ncbi:MAG: hypothetical protein ACP6IY_22940, partial [Promethearchaeia archaeon]